MAWTKINWRGRQYYAGLIQGLAFGFLLTIWLLDEKLGKLELTSGQRLLLIYGTMAVFIIGNIIHGSKKKKVNDE